MDVPDGGVPDEPPVLLEELQPVAMTIKLKIKIRFILLS
jgi:hypothetical protein